MWNGRSLRKSARLGAIAAPSSVTNTGVLSSHIVMPGMSIMFWSAASPLQHGLET